jgi:hypothetical protein
VKEKFPFDVLAKPPETTEAMEDAVLLIPPPITE